MKSDRHTTFYFPSSWVFGDCRAWLADRGLDLGKMRCEYNKFPNYNFELRGSEQHERTANWFG